MTKDQTEKRNRQKAPCPVDCKYIDDMGYCAFCSAEHRVRGCPPGPDCVTYAPKSKLRQPKPTPLQLKKKDPQGGPGKRGSRKPPPGGPGGLSENETACRLYAEGAHDGEIAKICGCSVHTVLRWRKATGRAANLRRKNHGNQNHDSAGGPG